MKTTAYLILSLLISLPLYADSDIFLGMSVMPGGETDLKTGKRLEMTYSFSHDEILAFYQGALGEQKDIKFRDWKDATRIEDHGNLPWHSISISKPGKADTNVIIVKDNWTWIIGTLILRYVGVFVVLLFLYLGMAFSGVVISRIIRRKEAAE